MRMRTRRTTRTTTRLRQSSNHVDRSLGKHPSLLRLHPQQIDFLKIPPLDLQ